MIDGSKTTAAAITASTATAITTTIYYHDQCILNPVVEECGS